jgi:putative FmdB family regulatory protein
MALYDYKCSNCGIFEVEQSVKDKPLTKCPKCHGPVKRVISSSGIVFKGSGFHVNDYRKDKPKEESKPITESKIEKKAEKKTDIKTKVKGSS